MESRKPSPVAFWKLTDKDTKSSGEQEKAEKKISLAAADAAKNAKEAAWLALPVITGIGIQMMGQKGRFSLAPLGFPVAVGGFIIDALKAPICVTVATEEAVRAGLTKIIALAFEGSPIDQQMQRIFQSFLLRMRETAALLVYLNLEQQDVLDKKFQSGDIEDLVGLTLLYTAYVSRHENSGLLLANQKTLTLENCPEPGKNLFNKIMNLKKSINEALNFANKNLAKIYDKNERNLEESKIVCQWIQLIKNSQPLTLKDKPDSTQKEIDIVNDIISQINKLKELGMQILPQEPEEIVRLMPGQRR